MPLAPARENRTHSIFVRLNEPAVGRELARTASLPARFPGSAAMCCRLKFDKNYCLAYFNSGDNHG